MKKLSTIAILLLVLAMAAAGCTPAAEPDTPDPGDSTTEPVFGGTYTYGIAGEPTTLNPMFSTDSITSGITDLVYESLLKTNENLELEGEIADSWTISDDGLLITFNLKDDVYFTDGVQLTSKDVKFTYDTIMDPDYSGVRARDVKYVTEVVAPSDFVVEFHLSQVDVPMMYTLAYSTHGIIPEHIFGSTPVIDLKEHVNSWEPIGSGPYKLTEYQPGQYIVLDANTDYHGEGPYIETVMIKIYQDNQVLLAAFENGDIDYIDTIPVDDIDHVETVLADQATFVEAPLNGYFYIGLKQNHPILGDLKVRQAMMYSLDRQSIIDTVFKGYGTMVNTHSVPFSWAYNNDINQYPQNIELAISLLEEAGWDTVGDDGIRTNANGDQFSFVLVSMTGQEEKANVIAMVKEQWKAVGIDMQVEYYERSVLFSQYLDVGKFEAYMWGWNLSLDPDCYITFHSDAALDENGVLQGFNDVEYKNAEVDQLLEEGRLTFDTEERKVIYGQIYQILNEELPYIFLYTTNNVKGMSNKMKDVVWSPLFPIDINKWYIDPAFH